MSGTKLEIAARQALEALEVYGEHAKDCPQYPTYTRPQDYPKCDCGYEEAIAALREALAEPTNMNLNCKSVQARLATSWGYVKAEQAGEGSDYYQGFKCGAETIKLVIEQAEQAEQEFTAEQQARFATAFDGAFAKAGLPQVTRADLKAAFKEGFERAADLYAPNDVQEKAEQESVRKRCKRCNDTGLVSDGEIDNIGGAQLEVPIECIRDCPDCAAPVQPVKQEPVAWVSEDVCDGQFINGRKRRIWWECMDGKGMAIYAAPVRTKNLTDEEIEAINGCPPKEWVIRFARAVIAAYKEKNK